MDNIEKWLQNLDQFRAVSKEIRSGVSGTFFTALAYVVVLAILFSELQAFLTSSYETTILMDQDETSMIKINFDIVLYDLPCSHLKLVVYDKFTEEEIIETDNVNFVPLDRDQKATRGFYTQEEIDALEKKDAATDVTEEERTELDADWSSTDDHFHHSDFNKAVTFHDYTIVNFFAEWCVHCRNFMPMWVAAANQMSEKTVFTDAEGKETTVKFLKINCVAFGDACQQARIAAFPTVRLYKRDGSFQAFKDKRSIENIQEFLKLSIAKSKGHVLMNQQHHSIFKEGCQVVGSLSVPRVPGHFYLQAEARGEENLNPALTNVSHLVKRLSFGGFFSDFHLFGIPEEMVSLIHPLDGKKFIVERFHEAPQHNLKIVATSVAKLGTWYQFTHNDRVRVLRKDMKNEAPQARFSYDFSPMSVVVTVKSRPWYEFLTSLLAILGGTYTIMELMGEGVVSAHLAIKEALGKAN